MRECPVLIEHVPKFIEMRRHLIMEQAKFPKELFLFFENMEQRSNPWGIAPTDRAKWVEELDVPILKQGNPVDYLFFVGCFGSFDSRTREVTKAIAKIFNAASLSWAILGNEEKCCGDSLRRLGNEYVFEQMARENIRLFEKYGVHKIVTHCPHGYTTFKNDYKQFGGNFEVIHHSELIEQLIREKRLKLKKSINERIIYHDPCYLGRYNNIYEPPRNIIRMATGGKTLLEMDRQRDKSFCCGAGGGRMWLDETEGKKIYLERTQEALRKNPSIIAVACPFCMTMFEDGVKQEDVEDKVHVKDIAEIVAQAMEL
jgi:Fe-S oxidoreductase